MNERLNCYNELRDAGSRLWLCGEAACKMEEI